MRALRLLHSGLKALGASTAQIALIILALGIFVVSAGAVVAGSLIGAISAASTIGLGMWVAFPLFWIFVVLIGVYIAPHAQPAIADSISILLTKASEVRA